MLKYYPRQPGSILGTLFLHKKVDSITDKIQPQVNLGSFPKEAQSKNSLLKGMSHVLLKIIP